MPQACDSAALHSTCVEGIRDYLFCCWDVKTRMKLSLESRTREVCGRAKTPHPVGASDCELSIFFSLKACYISLPMPESVFEGEKGNWLCRLSTVTLIPFSCGVLGNSPSVSRRSLKLGTPLQEARAQRVCCLYTFLEKVNKQIKTSTYSRHFKSNALAKDRLLNWQIMNFYWWQKQLIHWWSRSDAAVMGECLALEVACYCI